MDPSSSSAIPQRGEARRRLESTQSSPNQALPLTQSEMRQKIVEILAGTANGCLQELGYPAKVQELEARLKYWSTENLKLWEDNQRLVADKTAYKNTLNSLNAPEADKIRRIGNLEQENRSLKMQLEHMKAQVNAQHAQIAEKDQALARLHTNSIVLTESYNALYHDLSRLREATRGQNFNHPQPPGQASHQQQTSRNAQNTRRFSAPGVPGAQTRAQTQVQTGSRPPSTQHLATSRSLNIITSNVQQQAQRLDVGTVPSQLIQRSYIVPSSQANIQNSVNSPMNRQYQNQQNQQPSISPISSFPPQYQIASSQYSSIPRQNSSTGVPSNVRRASIANIPSYPHQATSSRPISLLASPGSMHNPNYPTTRVGSAPLPSQSPGGRLPPPLNAFNENMQYNNRHPTQPIPNSTRSYIQPNGQHVSQPVSISPQYTSMNPPPTLLAPTPTFPTNLSEMMGQSPSPSPSDTATIRLSIPRGESININASTTMPPDVYRSNGTSHSNIGSPVVHSRTPHLKREKMSAEADLLNESNKKPRLHSPNIESNTPPPSSPSVPPSISGRDMSAENSAPVSAIESSPIEQTMNETEEEEDDGVVEVGPDGLRLVDDILEQVYGENRRGAVVCWFCKHRYDNNYTSIPPTPFVNASDQELEQHCISEHLDAWNQARADV